MKKWIWRKVGMKLEYAVASWLANDLGLGDRVCWDTVGRVDVYLDDGKPLQIECKRLNKTLFCTRGWLKKHVVDRFREDAALKLLVTTKRCWSLADEFLMLQSEGIKVIEIGQINRKRELEAAKQKFIEQYLECVCEVYEQCQKALCR